MLGVPGVRSGERVVTAFFATRAEVAAAVGGLLGGGIEGAAVRVLPKSVHHPDDLGVRPIGRAPEGALLGAIVGGVAGALAGALAAGGSIVIPGLGAVLAGPPVAALAGAGAAGALGMLAGALAGARRAVYEAAYLEDAVRTGGALIAVRCSAERDRLRGGDPHRRGRRRRAPPGMRTRRQKNGGATIPQIDRATGPRTPPAPSVRGHGSSFRGARLAVAPRPAPMATPTASRAASTA